ncbi:MAG: hypothetical protein ACFFHV_16230 [Promethearchaeota archaeon]
MVFIFFFCFSTYFIIAVEFQNINSTTQNNDIADQADKDPKTSVILQKVTLIVGSDEDAANTGVLTFTDNINSEVEIDQQDNIASSDNNEILVIFSHGSENGIILDGELISWYQLSQLISQTTAKYIFLAACYGANIYNFTENTNKKIVGFGGVVDAILMGYTFALLVNALFNHLDDARNNAQSLILRMALILAQPELIVPLFSTACILTNLWFLFIPLYISITFHLKYSATEVNNIGTGTLIIDAITWVIGLFAGGLIATIILAVLTLYVLEFEAVLHLSSINHPDGGAWISIESVSFPPIGIWLQARNPSGGIVFQIPMSFDPISTTTLTSALTLCQHGWRSW